jgi:transcriptional regulator GlxA family with amidase domain
MKYISIVVFEDAVLSSLSSAYSLFVSTNNFFVRSGRKPPFVVELVGTIKKNIQLGLPVKFRCDKTIEARVKSDLIVVPPIAAVSTSLVSILKKNKTLIDWLRRKKKNGAQIVSLCTGSYFLAEAGLLNGKVATSHWRVHEDMSSRYPLLTMQSDKIITDNDGVYTAGGAYSSLNAILYLIEKFCGRTTALALSKEYSINYGMSNQSAYMIFQGQRSHNDEPIKKAQDYIEHNFKGITVDKVANHISMSKRNFIRRFKNATHNAPIEYIQRVKVEEAKKELEAGRRKVANIAADVGYHDLKTFRYAFKKFTGLLPQEYQKMFGNTLQSDL